MAKRPVNELTLREQFTEAERETRELLDHLERNMIPKIENLRGLVHVNKTGTGRSQGEVKVVTVRNLAAQVLESGEFTRDLCKNLEQYFQAINGGVLKIIDNV